MNLPFVEGGLKDAIKVADALGMCKGCHVRKSGGPVSCESCGAELCPQCILHMVERTRDHNAGVRAISGNPIAESNKLICEACGKVWGCV